jgi:hypothetical protein
MNYERLIYNFAAYDTPSINQCSCLFYRYSFRILEIECQEILTSVVSGNSYSGTLHHRDKDSLRNRICVVYLCFSDSCIFSWTKNRGFPDKENQSGLPLCFILPGNGSLSLYTHLAYPNANFINRVKIGFQRFSKNKSYWNSDNGKK